jgi:hypothetical protein
MRLLLRMTDAAGLFAPRGAAPIFLDFMITSGLV